ncbi:MAG: hypothetical protein HC906_15140 [Bacteroidales bacterium]|nr:hypothetical protein [Bacteroidales bacterium]
MKSGGTAYIQTPFKEGDIYENPDVKTKEERLYHFGQDDHVRIYSVSGLKDRLEKCGFQADILEFNEDVNQRTGYKPNEKIIIARKIG